MCALGRGKGLRPRGHEHTAAAPWSRRELQAPAAGGRGGSAPSCKGTDHRAAREGQLPPPPGDRTYQAETLTTLQSARDRQASRTTELPQGGRDCRQAAGEADRALKADGQTDDRQHSHSDKTVEEMTSLYWLSLLRDQWRRLALVGSGKGSWDRHWGWLQQRPRVLGSCGSSSTRPRADRCPGGRMGGVNPGPELSSLCWVLFLDGELTPTPCLPQVSRP